MKILVVTPDAETETRCASGRPCGLYGELMAVSARLRARGDEPAAQVLIARARWHRILATHLELHDLGELGR
jgi:hypothetical protein